jgi:hypothetical protein
MNPYNVPSLPAEQQWLGDAYNMIGVFSVILQFAVVVQSTFLLLMLNSQPSMPELVYYSALKGGPLLSLWACMLFVPNFALFLMIVIAAHLNSGPSAAWISTGLVVAVFCTMHMLMLRYACGMFPVQMWAWAPVSSSGFLYCSRRLKADAMKVGKMVVETAQLHIAIQDQRKSDTNASTDANPDYPPKTDENALPPLPLTSAEEQRLDVWIRDVLPNVASDLPARLVEDGITLDRLKRVAALPGGTPTVFAALAASDCLNTGECLAIAAAIVEQSGFPDSRPLSGTAALVTSGTDGARPQPESTCPVPGTQPSFEC